MKKTKIEDQNNKPVDFKTIHTIEQVYELADEQTRKDYDLAMAGYNTPDRVSYNKARMLSSVAWALAGKKVDGADINQKKWRPWFIMAPVFRFNDSIDCYVTSIAGAGSRLSFPEEGMSDYFGNKFLNEIYKDLQF